MAERRLDQVGPPSKHDLNHSWDTLGWPETQKPVGPTTYRPLRVSSSSPSASSGAQVEPDGSAAPSSVLVAKCKPVCSRLWTAVRPSGLRWSRASTRGLAESGSRLAQPIFVSLTIAKCPRSDLQQVLGVPQPLLCRSGGGPHFRLDCTFSQMILF